jgi:hypothetical protein
MSLVQWVTLDVLNVETFLRFYPILSVFAFEVVGAFDYSNGFPNDARTISVVFAVALTLSKPVLS